MMDHILKYTVVNMLPFLELSNQLSYLLEQLSVDGLYVEFFEYGRPLHMDVLAFALQVVGVDVPEYFEELVHEYLVALDLLVHHLHIKPRFGGGRLYMANCLRFKLSTRHSANFSRS